MLDLFGFNLIANKNNDLIGKNCFQTVRLLKVKINKFKLEVF